MDEELSKLIDDLVAKGASDEEIDIIIKDYQSKKPTTSSFERTGDFIENAPGPLGGRGIAKGLYDLGRTVYSGLTDQLPQSLTQAGEVVNSYLSPSNPKEFIRKDKLSDFQRYVREKDPDFTGVWGFLKPFGDHEKYLDKYANQFMIDNGYGDQITKMQEKLPEVIQRRVGKEQYVQQQKQEAQEKLAGITQRIEDVNSLSDALSLAGNFSGQALYQIPLSVLTRGGASFAMESATVYDEQLDELAKKYNITREEVIKRNLDQPALNQTYAMLAGGLDATSAGSILGAFRKEAQKSTAKKAMMNILGEAFTEGLQGNIERFAAKDAAGVAFDPLSKENLLATANETIGGALGAGIFSFSGKNANQAKDDAINKVVSEVTTGDPQIDAQIDQDATLTPQEEQVVRQNVINETLQEAVKEDINAISQPEPKEESKAGSKNTQDTEQNVEEIAIRESQIADATKQIQDLTTLLSNPEMTEEEGLDAYRQLASAKATLRRLAPIKSAISAKKSEIKTTIEDTTGVTKPEKSVKMTPNEAIKQQVQTFYRGVQEGVNRGVKGRDELVKKVQEAIKESPLSTKQVSTVLTKLRNTNLSTPGSISRLNDFIDKVTNEADYTDKLSRAKEISRKLRKLSKSPTALQNYKTVAKSFASLNPEDAFINKHLEVGEKILAGLTSPASEKYQGLNVVEAEEYINDLQKKIDEYQEEEIQKEPDGEKRNLQIFTALNDALEGLNAKDISSLDDSELDLVNSLKSLDPSKLSDQQASTAVKVIDNIVENDDFSNVGAIEPIVRSQRNLEGLKSEIGKTKDIKGVGKVIGNVYQQFGRVYGDPVLAAKVQEQTGITELANAGSRVENQEIKLVNDLEKKVRGIKKKYGTDVTSRENQVKLVIYAELVKNYGDDSHLPKVKRNIEQTINEHQKNDPEEAKIWRDAYEPYRNVESVEDVKISPALKELWDFFNQRFQSDINPRFAKVTNEIHNKPYLEANNYTHTSQEAITSGTDASELGKSQSVKSKSVKPKQSKTSITATRNLQKGHGYSSNFIDSQLRGYRDALYDIETSRPAALVRESMNSPQFEEVVGGRDNAELIRKMVIRAEELQRGMSRGTSNDAVKFLNQATQLLRSIGSARALGSVSQIVKQVPSVWIKSIFNHAGSGSFPQFLQALKAVNVLGPSEGLRKLFDQSTIGVRGERLGGIERGNSLSYQLTPGSKQMAARLAEKAQKFSDKLTRTSLKVLTNSDVYAARTTWLSYYLQSLKEQGVEQVDINNEYKLKNDPKRKQAVAFAEQMIAETQVPSNPAFMAQLSRNENDAGWNFAKNILLPFSTFSINAKYRHISDMDRFIRTPNAKTAAAVGGDLAEIAAFSTVAYMLAAYYKPLIKEAIYEIFDLDEPDEDEEKEQRNREKALTSSLLNQVSPISIGSVGESATALLANRLAKIAEDPDMSYEEWKKETGGFVYEPDKLDLGLLSLGTEPITEGYKGVINLAASQNDEPVTFDQYGRTEEAYLSDEQRRLLALKTAMEFSGMLGLTEADIYNQVRKAYKEQLELAK